MTSRAAKTTRTPERAPERDATSEGVPEGESHGFARAADGTRLFVRARGEGSPRAILCDGILCDGFIWKYAWDALAKVLPVAHWHYRGHGRSALPVDPER